MQSLFDTTRMFPESWIGPSDIGAFYRGMMDAVFANNAVTEALGNMTLLAGFGAVLAIPLVWLLVRLNRV